jgi:hypothetical protein
MFWLIKWSIKNHYTAVSPKNSNDLPVELFYLQKKTGR